MMKKIKIMTLYTTQPQISILFTTLDKFFIEFIHNVKTFHGPSKNDVSQIFPPQKDIFSIKKNVLSRKKILSIRRNFFP